MTKKCPECKRTLELNTCNFRCSCDGYWRNKCRDCQNKRKRFKYKNAKKNKEVKKLNPHKAAQEQRVQAMIHKYGCIFKTLKRLGVSPDAPGDVVDSVLEAAQRKAAC